MLVPKEAVKTFEQPHGGWLLKTSCLEKVEQQLSVLTFQFKQLCIILHAGGNLTMFEPTPKRRQMR